MTVAAVAAMRERPITFSAPMVLALLAGEKTQTRRIIAHPERFKNIRDCGSGCPYGGRGDRLWVRERCYEGTHSGGERWVRYAADGLGALPAATRWRPSIHMHRWASRILLEIEGVRVQRLQEISEMEARSEGVAPRDGDGHRGYAPARDRFADLWREIHGPDAWDGDPWVWVISFNVLEPAARARRSA